MIFFTNNNAIFVRFTRYTYQYYCSNLRKEEYQSAISVSAGMSLTYFASTVLSTSTKTTKPLCLQVGEHTRWTWFHAGDFRPELPNIVIDLRCSRCVTQSCVLIDTLLSNKTRCGSIISILMTRSPSSGPVHTYPDILEKWDFFFFVLALCPHVSGVFGKHGFSKRVLGVQ